MSSSENSTSAWDAQQAKNTRHLAIWTGGWVATLAVATFGSLWMWPEQPAIALVALGINVAAGVGMVLANRRHLRGLDELQQRIQLEAMALSMGVGLVVGMAYTTLDVTDVISGDAEISHLVMVMGLTYLVGAVVGTRRYQ